MRLFLFDVDGTLVSARGAGRAAMATALEATYGTRAGIDAYDFRGKTDPRAVLDILRAAGHAEADILARLGDCFARYVVELDRLIGDGERVDVMPGVPVWCVPSRGARTRSWACSPGTSGPART